LPKPRRPEKSGSRSSPVRRRMPSNSTFALPWEYSALHSTSLEAEKSLATISRLKISFPTSVNPYAYKQISSSAYRPSRQSTPHSRCHQDLTDYQKMQCPSSHNPQRYFLLRLICILPDCAPSPFLYILIC